MKDKILENLIKKEVKRQNETLDLIPSENIASTDILKVIGSPLTNKYSEGYPGKRYYPGNEYYDQIELLAQARALKAFALSDAQWAVNVQPYSGSPANLEIYFALLNARMNANEEANKREHAINARRESADILGMSLAHGGHLTHGHKVNFSGKIYNSAQYGVNSETGLLDYDALEKLALEHKPKIIISGATAYPRRIDFGRIGNIARKVGAYHIADISHIAGLVLTGLHPSPFSSQGGQAAADVVMTTTHKTLRGPRGAIIFSKRHAVCDMGHGKTVSISELIDKSVFPGMQGGPHNNIIAAIAEMFFEAMRPEFKKYQKQIVKNAAVLAESLKKHGLKLLTGGTDNHLMLIDLRPSGMDGMTAEKLLEKNGIIANRNSLPDDTSPFRPSGVRLGTPALTSRGMKEKEMRQITEFIFATLIQKKNIDARVKKLCYKFPIRYN